MENLNPLFKNLQRGDTILETESISQQTTKRATRSDKQHNIKFPVSPLTRMKLRTLCKSVERSYQQESGKTMSQTVFNTSLLRYGLRHPALLEWNTEYIETKTYMHVMVPKTLYQEIGGPYGLAIRHGLSERKVVFHIIHSILIHLERGNSIEKIIQSV